MFGILSIVSLVCFSQVRGESQGGFHFRSPIQHGRQIISSPPFLAVEEARHITEQAPIKNNRPYEFAYGVLDEERGTSYSRKEQSDSQGTKGQYQVRLPDGRIQTVTYVADENGYRAEVTYSASDASVPVAPPTHSNPILPPDHIRGRPRTINSNGPPPRGASHIPGHHGIVRPAPRPQHSVVHEHSEITVEGAPLVSVVESEVHPVHDIIRNSHRHEDLANFNRAHFNPSPRDPRPHNHFRSPPHVFGIPPRPFGRPQFGGRSIPHPRPSFPHRLSGPPSPHFRSSHPRPNSLRHSSRGRSFLRPTSKPEPRVTTPQAVRAVKKPLYRKDVRQNRRARE